MKKTSTFQERLKEGLRMRNMKPIDLCKKTGINKSLISYYMNGSRNPNVNNLYDIAVALGVNQAWLVGYDVSPNGNPIGKAEDELENLISLLTDEQRQQLIKYIKHCILS